MSKILLNGVAYDGVQHIQVPTEDGGVATFFANAEGIPSIDTLDDTLLVADNIGKFYKCGGKLYTVQKTYKPMSADAVAQITSLKGKTFAINANVTPSFDTVIGIAGTFVGTCYVDGLSASDIIVFLDDDEDGIVNDGWRFGNDAPPIGYDIARSVENFDYPDLNERTDIIEWIKLNGEFYEYGIGFQQIGAGIPCKTDILSVHFVVDENEGNIYNFRGETYILTGGSFTPVIEKPWDVLSINENGIHDVTNYATVRVWVVEE